jgi:hypothetical protein
MSDPRNDDRDDDRDEGQAGNYGPREETDEVTESDAGMTADATDVTPVPEDE